MSQTGLTIFTVIDVVLLIAGLAIYLFIVGGQLTRIAGNLEECHEIVDEIVSHAEAIDPGLDHVNRSGATVAAALPLLYGMAEGIVRGATYAPQPVDTDGEPVRTPAYPASGTRRSRIMESVGIHI